MSLFSDNESEKNRWIQKDLTKSISKPLEDLEKNVSIEPKFSPHYRKNDLPEKLNIQKEIEEIKKVNAIKEERSENKEKEGKDVGGESIVTLTLVDLYISQGYKDKALEVLEKLMTLNPEDLSLRRKHQELEKDLGKKFESREEKPLMRSNQNKEFLLIKGKMGSFLDELRKRAEYFKEA